MKNFFVLITALLLFNCKDSSKEKELLEKENELLKQEIELLKQEHDDNKTENSATGAASPSPVEPVFYAEGEGEYPQGSSEILFHADLVNLKAKDIKILRNEIFARHGYIFKNNELATYFNKQDWYKPMYNEVTLMLSETEQKNIAFIKENFE